MVENCDFLKRLRNVHLEKSAVTGLFHTSRSPMTAKVPLKAHLRLRFQNLGKPRTAGLCGRAARISDCGPLSCAFIERANKRRNPPKRGMAGRETSIPKGSVSHCRSRMHRALSHIAHKRRNARFKGLRRVHTCLRQQDRTKRITGRNRGVSAKSAESLRDSDALMRVAVPRRRGPAGLRDLFLLLSELWLTHHVFSAFRMCETRGGITTLGVLCVLPKLPAPAC